MFDIILELNEINDIRIPISTGTLERIKSLIKKLADERNLINQVAASEQSKNKAIESCLKELFHRAVKPSEMLAMAEAGSLSSTVQKIKRLIRERGNLWILKKMRVKGEIFYKLEVNKS